MINNEIYALAVSCIKELTKNGISLSCAESCTGGMFSSYITSVPGVSAVYEMGITTYSNRIKTDILGVNKDTVAQFGAVSRQTAKEMAIRIRKIASSDIGVSITGEAGPTSSEGKAPGTVYIALADDSTVYIEKLNINPLSRDYVRENAVKAVFQLVEKYIERRLSL